MLPTLQQAIKTIKSGDKITGRSMLADIIQADLENETAWLWMSSVVDTDAEKRRCLERVLAINPDNKNAQRGLAMLGPKDPAPPPPEPSPPASISDRLAATGAVAAAKDELYPIPTAKPIVEDSPPPEPAGEPEQVDSPETPDEIVDEEEDDDIPMPGPGGDEPDKIDETESVGDAAAVAIAANEPDEADLLDEEDIEDSDEEDDPPKPFWRTEQGKLLIAAGLVVIVLVCIACFVGTFVFRPLSVQVSSTVDSALGSPTPTFTASATGTPLPTGTPTATPTPTVTPSPIATSVVADTPTPTPTNTRPATPDRTAQTGQVVSVISGDVIEVVIDGESKLVKYISIQTPALNDPQLGTEPFGPEALQINQLLVSGQFVRLEKDITNADDQGRLLRHVFVGDMHINEELLRQGVARTTLVEPDLKYGARLQEVEQAAQTAEIGIWSIK